LNLSTSFISFCFTTSAVTPVTLSLLYTGFTISGDATVFAPIPPFSDAVSTFAAFR
jgi:hypothetical protein